MNTINQMSLHHGANWGHNSDQGTVKNIGHF